jgi:hypothetical protein
MKHKSFNTLPSKCQTPTCLMICVSLYFIYCILLFNTLNVRIAQSVFFILIVVLPCMLTITQLLLQQNAHFYY